MTDFEIGMCLKERLGVGCAMILSGGGVKSWDFTMNGRSISLQQFPDNPRFWLYARTKKFASASWATFGPFDAPEQAVDVLEVWEVMES